MSDRVCDDASGLLTLDEALRRLLALVDPVRTTNSLPLVEAAGRVLAEDVVSALDLPAFTNSAMDGYALRSGEGIPGAGLPVVGVSLAGQPFRGDVPEGACVRIFTGACLPPECDAVIMQEQTALEGGEVRLNQASPLKSGQNVRHQGEELRMGDRLLTAGDRLTPASLGLLAATGCGEVKVWRKPRVGFFSTGDELREPGQTLALGEIHESNRPVLHALLTGLGMEAVDLGVVRDNRECLRAALLQAESGVDVLITTGGASVGEADLVAGMLRELGRVEFWKVAIKPGKPFLFGHLGSMPVMGLPGNPVSMMVTFQQLVRPALLRMAGQDWTPPLRLRAMLRNRVIRKPGRLEFLRAVWECHDGVLGVTALTAQGSHRLTSMQAANSFIVLPSDCTGAEPGEWVDIELFGLDP